ncbi:MAG: hypothetical protein MNPFHGCM_03161 [Gemmatimonadaceae bacterium]|nr:hypothetical protein [Gemmatimonadaceae bacterium]
MKGRENRLDRLGEGLARRPYRPPIGIPAHAEPRAQATIASVLLHVAILLLILAPTVFVGSQLYEIANRGTGGPGPVGGGGGGTSGSGFEQIKEGLRYFTLPTRSKPAVQMPEEVVPSKPEKTKEPDPPKPDPEERPTATADTSASSKTSGATEGAGGGTGKDGTGGSGPGSGGGVGSGVGTGKGSGNGPGTGGGDADTVYPPTVISMQLLPLPVPSKVRPYTMVAYFEVDTTGSARLLSFNPSKDGNYNRRIRDMLLEMRFRPAVRGNGVPVKDTAVVTAEAR